MIQVEVGEPSPQKQHFQESTNEADRRVNLDLIQDVSDIAHIHEQVAK